MEQFLLFLETIFKSSINRQKFESDNNKGA